MAPKKSKKYVKFTTENVQVIESKSNETPGKTEISKRSHKGQGNPREKNALNNTEEINDKEISFITIESKEDIAQQSIQENILNFQPQGQQEVEQEFVNKENLPSDESPDQSEKKSYSNKKTPWCNIELPNQNQFDEDSRYNKQTHMSGKSFNRLGRNGNSVNERQSVKVNQGENFKGYDTGRKSKDDDINQSQQYERKKRNFRDFPNKSWDNKSIERRNEGNWRERKPTVDDNIYPTQSINDVSLEDSHKEWNDSGNGTFVESTCNEEKDDFWDVDEKKNSNYKQKNKSGTGYRKSESFVNDRKDKKTYYRHSDSDFPRYGLRENLADPEYREFQSARNEVNNVIFQKVKEIEEDLFKMPEEYSLGHCVAADMRMGSGIAVTFKKKFSCLGELLSQNQIAGGLALLEKDAKTGKRYIYYLVTKYLSNEKPTYGHFWSSLQKMRNHIRNNDVKKLAIPKIGCGLDRLEWSTVKHMLEFLFKDVDVEIVVCNFQQTEEAASPKDITCKVVYDEKPVAQIEDGTIIIYFSSENGDTDRDVVELSKKFNFIDHLKKNTKKLGDAIRFEDRSKNYILYGCIVRKTQQSAFDFNAFARCLLQIKKDNKKDQFYYAAYQMLTDDNDRFINEKIITLLRNLLREVDVYVCNSPKKEYTNVEE